MIGSRLKVYMPKSLFARSALILLVPVVTIMLVVSVVFIQRLYESVTRQMTMGVANEIRLVLDRIDQASDPAGALQSAIEVGKPLGIDISADSGTTGDRSSLIDVSGRVVIETLRNEIVDVRGIDLSNRDGYVQMAVNTKHGPVLLELPRVRVSARNPHQFLVLIGLTALLMTVIALVYLRNQVRPIRRLARAADAFGKGRSVPYRPAGATEVRQAGAAFLDMRDRIERQIEQRTLMLSGVSHDLRTPLTRMKLALSLMEDSDDTRAILRDVADMERMLEAFLAFARGEAHEDTSRTDPVKLARAAVSRAMRGNLPVTLGEVSAPDNILLRADAIARALDNLIGNAVRYGGKAVVSVVSENDRIVFRVEDPGPGIPENMRNEAQKPFLRLDTSRNQDGGSGVGLGLTIAADIARNHGGTLRLGTSPTMGGLKAEILIPH